MWFVVGRVIAFAAGLVEGRPPSIRVGRAWQPGMGTRQQLREDGNAALHWDERRLKSPDIKALPFACEQQRARELDHAHALLAAADSPPKRKREPIPKDVKHAVWQRDEGRCVEWGSDFDLQYDRVIPFSMGGGNSVENHQLL